MGKEALNVLLGCSVPAPWAGITQHFLKIVVKMKALAQPHVLELWLV